jgi:uncharacterized protein (TIGR02996 family)
VSSLRSALEDAIAADFDDRAAHAAYADHLSEQGDPRGEFIQVQLALEQGTAARERKRLRTREKELLGEHQREWLGGLAARILDEKLSDYRRKHDLISRARWERGWLQEVYLWWVGLAEARALARCPLARMLQRLDLHHVMSGDDESEPEADDGLPDGVEFPSSLYPLGNAPFLPQLRWLGVGEQVDFENDSYNNEAAADGLVEILAKTTRLEELHVFAHRLDLAGLFALTNLTRLRCMVLYHGREDHPLEVLAGNPAFAALERLRIHPAHSYPTDGSFLPRAGVAALLRSPHFPALRHLHLHSSDLGDEGCEEVVRSGALARLETLDLRHGCVSDAGARILVGCPDTRRLKLLSLQDNELSDEGCAMLQGLGIEVRCGSQHDAGSNEYLWSGDME